MWALWHGQRLDYNLLSLSRVERFAVLDAVSEACLREGAARVIDLWQSDNHPCQGAAYRIHVDRKKATKRSTLAAADGAHPLDA